MPPTIVVAIIAAIPGILTVLLQLRNRKAIHEVHLSINSRVDELIKATSAIARNEGIAEGKKG